MTYREITADQLWCITQSESRLFTCDFTDLLGDSETLSAVSGTNGGVTLGVSANALVTVGSPAINVGALTDDEGETVAIGKAVQVRLYSAAGVVGTTYDVTFTVLTSAGNRLQQVCKLQIVS